MTSVELFAATLRRRGVDWIATLCGHGLDPLFHAARKAGIRLVDVRNEQTAGYIANYYGCLARRPGVCASSSGVAQINGLTGVANAWFDSAPMLLISGSAALRTEGLGHFQDMDQVALAQPVTRYARLIAHPERAVQMLEEALDAAEGEPPGPAYLTYPMDVQRAEASPERMVRPAPPARVTPAGDVEAAARALAQARRPYVVAGSGIYYAGEGAALVETCERLRIPFAIPIWDRGFLDAPSPAFVGIQGALSGGPRILDDADCIVMAGAIADYRVGHLQTEAAIVRLTRGWAELNRALQPVPAHAEWLAEARRRREEFRQSVERNARQQASAGTHVVHILDALGQILTPQTHLLIDGGSVGQWTHHLMTDRYPSRWLTCGRSGVVGWGLGGAMAARLADPAAPVILLSGDGAFTFTVAEIECAVRQNLPFVAIVADDLGWGITRSGHVRQFGEPIASSLGPVDFVRLAESLGAKGVRAAEPAAIEPAVRDALASGQVTVIHVPVTGGNP